MILIHNLLADYHSSLSEEEVGFHLNNYSSSDPEEEASAQQLKVDSSSLIQKKCAMCLCMNRK